MIGIGGYVGLFDDPNTFRRLDNCQHFVDVAVDENNNDDDFDDETRQAADLEISVDEPGFFRLNRRKTVTTHVITTRLKRISKEKLKHPGRRRLTLIHINRNLDKNTHFFEIDLDFHFHRNP